MIRDDALQRAYHQEYCLATGLDLPYRLEYDYAYGLFARQFQPGDITAVVRHIRNLYRDNASIRNSCLRWSYLIRDCARFSELLAEAKASERNQIKSTPKDQVLQQSGRPQCNCGQPAKSTGQIMEERGKLADMLATWRKESLDQPPSASSPNEAANPSAAAGPSQPKP